MLDKMRQQGKPVDARMQKLADWMDKMEIEGDGMVSCYWTLTLLILYLLNLEVCFWILWQKQVMG